MALENRDSSFLPEEDGKIFSDLRISCERILQEYGLPGQKRVAFPDRPSPALSVVGPIQEDETERYMYIQTIHPVARASFAIEVTVAGSGESLVLQSNGYYVKYKDLLNLEGAVIDRRVYMASKEDNRRYQSYITNFEEEFPLSTNQ